jgi:hypothetical protein
MTFLSMLVMYETILLFVLLQKKPAKAENLFKLVMRSLVFLTFLTLVVTQLSSP